MYLNVFCVCVYFRYGIVAIVFKCVLFKFKLCIEMLQFGSMFHFCASENM